MKVMDLEKLKTICAQLGIVLTEEEITYFENLTGKETGPYTAEFSAL
jgi:hypothetical protein